MAGGIDWFRWHHGSVTDPKFQLVARKSKQSLATVIAVWAFVLEKASASEDRGHFGGLDYESVDCMFGLDDGATQAILSAMADRGLVDADRVASWEKRQVKRERTDDVSTDRVKAFRSKERQETPKTNDETPCNAMERQETPREEKRREEEIREEKEEKTTPRKRVTPFLVPEWINRDHWDAWHSCSKRRNATDKQKQLAVDKLTAWRAEGIDHAAALENAAIGGWQGLFKPDEQKAGGGSAVNKQEALEQRNRGVASSWAAGIGNYV